MSVRFDTGSERVFRTATVPTFGDFSATWWAYRVTDLGDNEPMFAYFESGGGTALYAKTSSTDEMQAVRLDFTGNGTTTWGTAVWRRFALVFDNTNNTVTLYSGNDDETTDLTQVGQVSETGSITVDQIAFGGTILPGSGFNGRVANLKLYTAILSTARLKEELAYFNIQDSTNIWGAWLLKDHTVLTDNSGNSRDLSANGTLSTEADPPIADDPTGGITFVNSTALTIATAASTWSIPTHSSRVGGAAFLVGLCPASSAVTVSTVTDNIGNTYTLAARAESPKPAAGAELWYATNISSASTRVSVTLSGLSSGSLAIGQWNGVSTGNAKGSTGSSAITANSTVHTVVQITPSATGCLVVCLYRTHASTVVPVTMDDSQSTWVSTAMAARMIGGYKIQTAASTYTGQWRTAAATSTGGVQHAAVIASFFDTASVAVAAFRRITRTMFGVGR